MSLRLLNIFVYRNCQYNSDFTICNVTIKKLTLKQSFESNFWFAASQKIKSNQIESNKIK